MTAGKNKSSIDKQSFPGLLLKTLQKMSNSRDEVIRSGFRKAGIVPVNREKVLNMLPQEEEDQAGALDVALISPRLTDFLKETRYGATESQNTPKRKKCLSVAPGKSVKITNIAESSSSEDMNEQVPELDDSEAEAGPSREADDVEMEADSENDLNIPKQNESLEGTLEEGMWVVVNFGKKTPKLFIGHLTNIEDGVYEANFVKSALKSNKIFIFDENDVSTFGISDVVKIINPPKLLRRGRMEFNIDLNQLQVNLLKSKPKNKSLMLV